MMSREDMITWSILNKVLDVYFDADVDSIVTKVKQFRKELFEAEDIDLVI